MKKVSDIIIYHNTDDDPISDSVWDYAYDCINTMSTHRIELLVTFLLTNVKGKMK